MGKLFGRHGAEETKAGKHSEIIPCTRSGCMRPSWNGKPEELCCRTCKASDGREHGPTCERKFAAEVAKPECITPGCRRRSWNGRPGGLCCRSCFTSNGKDHGRACTARFGKSGSKDEAEGEEADTNPLAEDNPEYGSHGPLPSKSQLPPCSTKKRKALKGELVTYIMMCERLSLEDLDSDDLLAHWHSLPDAQEVLSPTSELMPLKVDPDTLNRAPTASDFRNPGSQRPCSKGCGRMAFDTFPTCCPRCSGSDKGPHSRDCADKQE